MTARIVRVAAPVAATLAGATSALAHPSGGGSGFGAGLAHPFHGIDHVMAMVAVGIVAAAWGGRAVWALPLAFVAAVAAGWATGGLGLAAPHVEGGLVLSVIALGLLVASGRRFAMGAGVSLMVAFGSLHGLAHGSEIAATAAAGTGLVAATASLHAAGVALGFALVRGRDFRLAPAAGLAIAFAGVALFVA